MVNITNIEQCKRTVSGELRDIRFVVMLTEKEDQAIQSYRFACHIGSKGEAMRTLIRKGLEAEKVATAGEKFGDPTPTVAGHNNSSEECCDAAQR
jgi:hypothetical protein